MIHIIISHSQEEGERYISKNKLPDIDSTIVSWIAEARYLIIRGCRLNKTCQVHDLKDNISYIINQIQSIN